MVWTFITNTGFKITKKGIVVHTARKKVKRTSSQILDRIRNAKLPYNMAKETLRMIEELCGGDWVGNILHCTLYTINPYIHTLLNKQMSYRNYYLFDLK